MRWMVSIGLVGCAGGLRATNADGEPGAPVGDALTADTGPFVAGAEVSWSARSDLVTQVDFDLAWTGAAGATLTCVADADPAERHVLAVAQGRNPMRGWLANTAYGCTLTVAGEVAWTGEVATQQLPPGLPVLGATVRPGADLAQGYVVTNHWSPAEGVHRALVLDGHGHVRWYRTLEGGTGGDLVVRLVGDRVLVGGGQGVAPAWFDLDGARVFEVAPPPDGEVDHHEAGRTDEGYVLRLSTAPLEHPAAEGFAIEVTDPTTREVVWSYDAQEGVLAGDWTDLDLRSRDPFGADAALWLDDARGPAVWVSLRTTSSLVRLDRATGRVTARVGAQRSFLLVDRAEMPLPSSEWFYGQHAPEFVGDRLFVFDNGTGRPGPLRSRAVEYRVDLDRQLVQKVWEWSEEGWYEPDFGSVSLRPSGHVLVASGHSADVEGTGGAGRTAFVLEVDPATQEVLGRLDFASPDDTLYRAQLVPGCALFANARYCPELDAG